jgi:tetraprenyl-beta-curcumene synthase
MYRLYRHIFPTVRAEVGRWRARAEQIPDPELRKQALASIDNKLFHCEGGCVYAAAHMARRESLIRLIVAYQTISDYLDNLCDRSTSLGAENFARLHQSMLDAVSGTFSPVDYYEFNGEKDDGGYLRALVATCHAEIKQLPHYALVQNDVYELASLYCDLQIHKHVIQEEREPRLLTWWEQHRHKTPGIGWNEFAAATGSTLGLFHLFQLASHSKVSYNHIMLIKNAYFPWICSLHILLDYLIDLEEDSIGGDLNFIAYYENEQEIYERMCRIVAEAKKQIEPLPDRKFHSMIIDGLIGLYLSDGKVQRQPMVQRVAKAIIRSSSFSTRFFFFNSRGYRGGKAVLQAPPTGKQAGFLAGKNKV